jgi:hypothetical protein
VFCKAEHWIQQMLLQLLPHPGVYGDLTQQHSVHLALASLVLGSRGGGPLVASFEVSCCRFDNSIRRPEAHIVRGGPIGTIVSLPLGSTRCLVAPAGPLVASGRQRQCGDRACNVLDGVRIRDLHFPRHRSGWGWTPHRQ